MAEKTTAVMPWDKKRAQVLAEMTPACQSVAKDFDEKLAAAARGPVLINYDMGARLKEVIAKPNIYGQDALKQLEAYLPITQRSRTALVDLKNFASEWTKDEIKAMFGKPMANGDHLSYFHFRALMRVKSKKDQQAILNKVRAECVSAGEMEGMIRAEYETKSVRSGGRNPKEPVTPLAGLQAAWSNAKKLSRYLDLMDEKVFGRLEELPPDQIEENHLAKIEAFKDQITEVIEKEEKALKDIVKAEERIRRVLAKKAKGEKPDTREEEDIQEKSDAFEAHVAKAAKTASNGKAAHNGKGKPEVRTVKPRAAEGKPAPAKSAKTVKSKSNVRRRPAAV